LELEIEERSNIIVDTEEALIRHFHVRCIASLKWYQNRRGSPNIVVVGFKIGSHCVAGVGEKENWKREKSPKIRNTKRSRKLEKNGNEE
jgi:hypothetical protein